MGVRVAVVGASGYAGGELVRLVVGHPDLELVAVTARGNAGRPVGDMLPNLRSVAELTFAETSADAVAEADLIFLAMPHGAAPAFVAGLPQTQRIVDLGSDFRLTDPAAHGRYYGGEYSDAWTYGLPEL
ncbi:MAG: N-acetyl-gamma-glutamyl-phosphate reductase, partial [Jatrophihabitantaceae bacterium]